jgi:hypothetical protein
LAAVQQAGLGLQQAGEGVQVCADTCATPTALKNKNKTSAFFMIRILLMVNKICCRKGRSAVSGAVSRGCYPLVIHLL